MANFNLSDYVTVQDRIVQFWTDHPNGHIITNLMSDPGDFQTCRYKAEVYTSADETRPRATGWAFELAGKGMANQTSHEENCETSAIGRALANLGYATSQKDRPSREEMGKVARNSATRIVDRNTGEILGADQPDAPEPTKASPEQLNWLRGLTKQLGQVVTHPDGSLHHDPQWLDAECKATTGYRIDQLSPADATRMIDELKRRIKGGQSATTAHDPRAARAVDHAAGEDAYGWTQLWAYVRSYDDMMSTKPKLEKFIGATLGSMTPAQVRTAFDAAVEKLSADEKETR